MIDEIFRNYFKEGLLAALVIYLLWQDRKDRIADREFWVNLYKEKRNEKDTSSS